MTIDPFQLYDWLARFGFPGAMALFIWASYTRRVRWNTECLELTAFFEARIGELVAAHNARVREIVEERNARVAELLGERNEFKDLVIGGQRNLAKSLDVISETTKTDPKRLGR
jgi:hypothetical protein